MMIFKKAIPRRLFLRGMGASIALPLLDGMVPAFATTADTAAKTPVRLSVAYVPNGMWPMDKWTPKKEGSDFELTPTLEPLAKFKDQLIVLSGLAQKEALPVPGEGAQEHSRACGTFLTGVRAKQTGGKDIRAAVSMDQIAAAEIGKDNQLTSLEISLCDTDLVGSCEPDYSCVYLSTIAWRTPTTPLPMENKPRAVFERLFGDSDTTDRDERLTRIQERRSILDWLSQRAATFMKGIDSSDRAKLNEYLDAIRDVERRIQIAEDQANREIPKLDRPVGVPERYDDYAKLMVDMQVLAYQTDLTRVITFMMGREGPYGGRAYPEIGVADLHHNLSHHQNDSDKVDKLFRINLYHMKMFTYLLEKMRATPDGDGSLLDHSMLIYGSPLGNGNIHEHINLPVLMISGKAFQIKGNRHLQYPQGTPMTNLYLTVLDKLGVPVEKLGDSNGKLNLLSV